MKLKLSEKQHEEIIKKYLDGVASKALAVEYNVSQSTINRVILKRLGRQVYRLSNSDKNDIIEKFKLICIGELAKEYNVHENTIRRILFNAGVREKKYEFTTNGGFSEKQKKEMIRLYTKENRGKDYIAGLFNCSDYTIKYWFEKWGVKTISRSSISKKIREIYGTNNGFEGKKHTLESKLKIRESLKKSWKTGNRKPTIGKSRTYTTIVGKVLGKYEVAFLQKFYENGESLPQPCRKRYKTPYGTYMPDFIIDGKFIEVKSKFTLQVAKGIYSSHGKCSDNQWKKICFFRDNIATLEVVVLDKIEVKRLFENANNEGVITSK